MGLEQVVAAEMVVKEEEQAQDVPQNHDDRQVFDGKGVRWARDERPDGVINGEDEGDDDEASLDDPR